MKKADRTILLIMIILISFGFSINFIATSLFPAPPENPSIDRVILFSIDSANPEYLSEDMMPNLFAELLARGSKYKLALTSLAAETQHGHTSMLTGAYTNNSGMIGNGLWLNDTKETMGVVLDPKYRLAETLFESIQRTTPSIKTAFLSGKWRLPPLLSQDADLIFASPVTEEVTGDPYPLGNTAKEPYYLQKLGLPLHFPDGDLVDSWVMRALLEVIKEDDPAFIFCNLAWSDVFGHNSGGIGDYSVMIRRQLTELDALFMYFFTELRAMGEYENTLFIFTSDHGMETIERQIDVRGYLSDRGIIADVHAEGGSGFIFLENISQTALAVNYLRQNPALAVVLNRTEMAQYPYALNTFENRTGQVYVSAVEHTAIRMPPLPGLGEIPLIQIGSHGGIAVQDVVMAWMGPNITKWGYEITTVPHIVDIVPTICNLTGWALPFQSQGRVLYEIIG